MHGKVAAASKIEIHLRTSRKVRRPGCNGHNSKLSARSSSVNRHEVARLTKDYGPRLLALCSAARGTLGGWSPPYCGACSSLFFVIAAAEILLQPDIQPDDARPPSWLWAGNPTPRRRHAPFSTSQLFSRASAVPPTL